MKIQSKTILLTILICLALINSIYAGILKEITNINTSPFDMVIGNNQTGYISAPDCNCILVVDLSKESPDALENQINIPNTAIGNCHSLAINMLRNELYVLDSHSKLFIINTLTNTIDPTPITLGLYPKNIVISPDGNMIYVCSKRDLTVIKAQDKTVASTIPFSESIEPYGMAIANQKLYVVGTATHTIYVIDLISASLIHTIDVSSSPYDAIATGDESTVYVSHDVKDSTISVINTTTDSFQTSIDLSEDDIYKNSKGLAISHSVLYVANYGDGSLSLIDILNQKKIQCEPPVQSGDNHPERIAVSTDGNDLYIVHPENDSVRILDSTQISKLPFLSLSKKGRGEIQIDDGVNISKVLPPVKKQFPKGTRITLTALPHDQYVFSEWAEGISGYHNPIDFELNENTSVQAIFSESTGYAIIIQGKRVDGEGVDSHRKTTDLAESIFKQRRLVTHYLKYDDTDSEYIPTLASIEYAITDWAFTNMYGKAGKLIILIVGHGKTGQIYFNSETLTSDLFKEWLNALQTKLENAGQHNDIVVILGTCHSGSFIEPLSGEDRIIITSSHAQEMAFKGPVLDDGIRQGDFFVAEFLKIIQSGMTIKKSFMEAALLTHRFTYAVSDDYISLYNDRALQHPMIDDNSDGEGSHDLRFSITGEGQYADSLYIGSLPNKRKTIRLYESLESDDIFLNELQETASFQLNASALDSYDLFWIDIKTPLFSVGSQTDHTKHLEINTQRWERSRADMTSEGMIEWSDVHAFITPGEYQVLFFAKENNSNTISFVKEINVFKQKLDNHSPDQFALIRPKNEEIYPIFYASEQQYFYGFEWEKASDPDGDTLHYDISISPYPNDNGVLRIKGLIKNQYIITFSDTPTEDSLEMDKTYYLTVTAIDQYGASQKTEECFFMAKNPSGGSGYLLFEIVDAESQKRIRPDSISAQYTVGMIENYFYISAPTGDHSVTIQAVGYESIHKTLTVPDYQMNPTIKEIPVKRLFHLSDIVKALGVLTRFDGSVSMNGDVNDDHKFSVNDAVYIFQRVSAY